MGLIATSVPGCYSESKMRNFMLYYGTCRAWQGAGSCTDRGLALKGLQDSVGEETPAKKLQHKAKAADAFEEAQIKHKESPAQGKGMTFSKVAI